MKNPLMLLLFSFITVWSFAQQNCLDFENETPNLNAGYTLPIGSWNCINCLYDYKQDAVTGSIYLEAFDQSGGSWIYNNTDFTGDLSNANECQTFCYDINYLQSGTNLPFYTNSIYLYSGGTDPQSATLCARYILNTPVNAGNGWTTTCLPLDLCNGGVTLPFNTLGYWQWYTSGNSSNVGANCNDWNTLIQNVSGLAFFVDRGSEQSEQWGYDNFCLIDTTCYNNKTFSSCTHTDPIEPLLNDHNESAYGGIQTDDGEYFIFGETANRNLPGENNPSEYLLYTSLDAIGNVNAPSNYVYSEEPATLGYTDHFVVDMDPVFASEPVPYVVFTNYQEVGTFNKDIQITFLDESDCVTSVIDWPDSPNISEVAKDAIQASNGDLIILGEWNDVAPVTQRHPFLYGFTIPGSSFGNSYLNYIDASGSSTINVDARAICEYSAPGVSREFKITGQIDDNLLFQTLNSNLAPTGVYNWYDIDNNSSTNDIGIDIVFDAVNDEFLIAGNVIPDGVGGINNEKVFLTRINMSGQVVWTKIFNIPGGGEVVEEMHLNDKGEIAITGSCERALFTQGGTRDDISYLLKTNTDGNLIFTNKYFNAEGNEVQDLQYCIDEGYLLTGSCWTNVFMSEPFPNTTQNHDIWTVKTDSLGNISENGLDCVTPVDVVVTEPTSNQGVNESWPSDFELDGANYDYICTPFVHNQEICEQYCPPPPGPDTLCDITSTLDYLQNDTCCVVTLDLVNNMYGAHKVQVDIINPGTAYFDWTQTSTPFCSTRPSPSSVIIERCNNTPLPIGTSADYLSFCMADSFNTSGLQTLKVTYLDSLCQPIDMCMDTLEVECEISSIEEDCYEVLIDTIYCDTIPGLFNLCLRVKNNGVTNGLSWLDLASSNISFLPSSQVGFSPPVQIGNTSPQVCIQLFDFSGLSLPRDIKIDQAAHDSLYQYCCNDLDSLCVTLPNCCDPCLSPWVALDTLSSDSCCYALDITVDCPLTMTKVVLESLTPGVLIGSAFVGGSCAPNWNIGPFNQQFATYTPVGGTAPVGFCDNLISFCLDDTLGVPLQQVAVHYITMDNLGQEITACSDTMDFNCSQDIDCLQITHDSVYCDANGDYFLDFCVKNTSNPAFNADQLVMSVKAPNPFLLNITPNNLFPITLNHNTTYCGTVQIIGVPTFSPFAGQDFTLGFAMHENNAIGKDTCCIEDETLHVILPPCTDCCEDFDDFCNNITYSTSIYGICDTGYVQVAYGDSCTYTDIDWGDGSTASFVGTFQANHSYTTPGSYIVCADFKESTDGGMSFCWNKVICDTLMIDDCPNGITPCDSIEFDTMAYLGWAAATCQSQGSNNGYVCGIIDIRNHNLAPLGNNWGPPYDPTLPPPTSTEPAPTMNHGGGTWTRGNMGEVKGIAVDPYGNIYVTAFSMYQGTEAYGPTGIPSIYKLNPYTNAITNLGSLPQSPDPARANQMPAYGNVAYNFTNHRIYVTNLEDGKIYPMDANAGTPYTPFDHLAPDSGTPGFAPLGQRILGVGYNHVEHRIYYGVWNMDTNTGPIAGVFNEIWSIALDQNGDFVGAATYEFALPYLPSWGYSNPVSDISFDATGTKMLISEMTIEDHWNFSTKLGMRGHRSRNLEYYAGNATPPFSLTYVPQPTTKYTPSNAAGGNDYAYGDSTLMHCDSTVVVMEDALSQTPGNPPGGLMYGLRGMSNQGSTKAQSWMLDLDGNLMEYDKRELGDVEVFRNLCCSDIDIPPPPNCDSLDWTGFDVILDTMCVGNQYPDVGITPVLGSVIPDWITYDFDCDLTINQTDFGPTYPSINWPNSGNSFFLICATAYKIIGNDTCDFEVIKEIGLEPCPPPPANCDSLDWTGFESAGNPNFFVCATAYKIVQGDTCEFEVARDLFLEPCPLLPVCCQDSLDFVNAVDTGFVFTLNNFDLTIDNALLDSCHEVTVFWGDGTDDSLNGSAFPIVHTYIASGQYTVCILVQEYSDDGTLCWEREYCDLVSMGELSDCCQNEDDFINAVDTGFVLTQNDPTLTIDNPLLDSCHQVEIFWGDGNSDSVNGSALPVTHPYSQVGMYNVCILVTELADDGSICWEREFCESIEIILDSNEELYAELMRIYPNPTDSRLVVDFGQLLDFKQIEIYDAVGRLVMTHNATTSSAKEVLDVNELPDGMYIVRVVLGGNYNWSERFIKQQE